MAIGLVSTTIRARGNLTVSYQYTVAGQQPEVITEQMAAQSQSAPARGTARVTTSPGLQACEQFIQPVPLDGAQSGIIA